MLRFTTSTTNHNLESSENNPSTSNEENIIDRNNEPLQEFSESANVESISKDASNKNILPSCNVLNNLLQSINSASNHDAKLSENNPRNRRLIINLAVEDCEIEEDEDLITNLDLDAPSSKSL